MFFSELRGFACFVILMQGASLGGRARFAAPPPPAPLPPAPTPPTPPQFLVKSERVKIVIMFNGDTVICDLQEAIEFRKKENKPFTETEIRQILAQILEAILVLHSHKILHRDLKP